MPIGAQWHEGYGDNQLLSDRILGVFYRREFMPSTYYKLCPKLMIQDVKSPRGEPKNVILSNRNVIKLSSKYFLYPQIGTVFTLGKWLVQRLRTG